MKMLSICVGVAAAISAMSATSIYASTEVAQWNEATLQSIRTTKPGPPIVARMLAVTHTCMYDAWAAYDQTAFGTQLKGALRRPAAERTDANKKAAISYAAHACLKDLFPTQSVYLDGVLSGLGLDPANASLDPNTAAGIGHLAAQAVIQYRHNDGSNQLGTLSASGVKYSDYTGYTPVNTPDIVNDAVHWQPLKVTNDFGVVAVQKFVAPQWENVKPFALKSASQFDDKVDAPQVYPSAGYTQQVDEIIAYSANLTDRQKVIAEYWADGPTSELPPGHWGLFAQFVSERDHHNNDQDAKMFFAMHNAIFDASIVSWHLKRKFDYVRPITALHVAKQGQKILAWAGPFQGTKLIDAADWRPYQAVTVVTPPFPEYVSGHSIFSRSGAEILTYFTGSEYFGASYTNPQGVSRVEPGVVPATDITLSWATFKEAADEAGFSRRYGGIHFVQGDLQARKLGPKIAERAWEKAQNLFAGRDDK